MTNYKLHQVRGHSIVTTYVNPPIPYVSGDYCAHIDGEEELGEYGYGATEQEAIDNLIELLQEQEE